MAGKAVHWSGDQLEFCSERSVHRSQLCGFRLSGQDRFIDIASVWYMVKELSAGDVGAYTEEAATTQGYRYIGGVSGSGLMDWLHGRVETCEGLVVDVIEGRKRPRAFNSNRVETTFTDATHPALQHFVSAFAEDNPPPISAELEGIIMTVAKTGQPGALYPWCALKHLLARKLEFVLAEFWRDKQDVDLCDDMSF